MLDVHNLSIQFSNYTNGLARKAQPVIRSLDLSVNAGEVLAVVGQSGAGKSLLAHALLGILPSNARLSGRIRFKGKELTPRDIKSLRGREIALVPQSMTYLNPLLHVGVQITRAAVLSGISTADARQSTLDALQRYRLDKVIAQRFPFQLSGGMARRILTATATIGDADLILADEPTNGLDPSVATETLCHLRELADLGKAVLLITHDIDAALKISDRLSIFCGGVTVEDAAAASFTKEEMHHHPYTTALFNALPDRRFTDALPDYNPDTQKEGCPFSAMCQNHEPVCRKTLPDYIINTTGRVRCHHA